LRALTLSLLALSAKAEMLTLRQAVEKAAELNPDVAIARLRIVEADAEAGAASARYLPQVNGRVDSSWQTNNLQGIGITFPGVPSRIGPFWVFNARPVLTQVLFDGPLRSQIISARVAYTQNRHNADAVRETTQLAVLELYLQALQSQSRLRASEARLDTARAVLKQATDKEELGGASKLDVARATQEFQNEEAARLQFQRDLDVLRVAIARTIGLPDANFDLEALAASPLAMLPPDEVTTAAAVNSRPEALAAESGIRRAELDFERARREYWPKLNFSSDFGVLGASPAQNVSTYTVGASLTFPIWTSGRIEKEKVAAQARADQARESFRQTKLSIEEDVRRSMIEWQASRNVLDASDKAASAAKESVELSMLRFESGLSTNIDTITAQSRLAEAEDLAIRSRYDVLRARARNARARGNVLLFFEGI
jgi:outer membrane protein TolC